jgi:hypothetical protein
LGAIRSRADHGRTLLLEPEYLIGRVAICSLRLTEAQVSAQQALLRWAGGRWELRDLGSRNGTFVDGVRLNPGENHPLHRGARLDFGTQNQPWEFVDDAPPSVMAVPLGGGDPILLEGDFIGLPSGDDPRVTIYRGPEGWLLEQSESVVALSHLQTFQVDSAVWRFCCPEGVHQTEAMGARVPLLELEDLELVFSVSSDEEHVQLRARSRERDFDLGDRNHNYLLLMLARQRLADRHAGELESACGWIYQDEFGHDPTLAAPQLNVDIFRIRKQFATLGAVDAAAIVERRPRTKQLRIGVAALVILPA